MSDYDFILDNLRFSFSSVSSFETCKLGFKLAYIDRKDREGSFYGDYGSFIHSIIEKYVKNELDISELLCYYTDHYQENVKTDPPIYPSTLGRDYYEDGFKFFKNFKFDTENYEFIFIEDSITYEYKDIKLIVKPDLVLKNKKTNKIILVDYKTSKLKGNSYDKKKIEGYKKQMLLYVYFIWQAKKIPIDSVSIWFVRNNEVVSFDIDNYETIKNTEWFENTISKIKQESDWTANNSKSNKYFCENLCGTRKSCPYYLEGNIGK